MQNNDQKQIAGAIIIAGVIIAGAILLKGNKMPVAAVPTSDSQEIADNVNTIRLDPISPEDRTLGNSGAAVVIVEYADFQCPFCGKFFMEAGQKITTDYVNTGKVQFVYRDYPFLGNESVQAAIAARCAEDQGKFWQYHDYLFSHQSGENRGQFSNQNLKLFAKNMGLDTAAFNGCLDAQKHTTEISLQKDAGGKAGVEGTPKGFILKNGKVVDTINGAEPTEMVTAKIEKALK